MRPTTKGRILQVTLGMFILGLAASRAAAQTPTVTVSPCQKCVGQKPDTHAIDIDASGNANPGKECVRVSKAAGHHIVWTVDPTKWSAILVVATKCPFKTCQIPCDQGGHCDSGKVVAAYYGCLQYHAVSASAKKTGTDPEVTIDP